MTGEVSDVAQVIKLTCSVSYLPAGLQGTSAWHYIQPATRSPEESRLAWGTIPRQSERHTILCTLFQHIERIEKRLWTAWNFRTRYQIRVCINNNN